MIPSAKRRYRAALITGASSGIGEAFARKLGSTTDLVLVARAGDALERVRQQILNVHPERQVACVAADLTAEEGLKAACAAAEAAEIDLLVNNAGMGSLGPVLETDPAVLTATLRLNVEAPVRLARALVPGMLARAKLVDPVDPVAPAEHAPRRAGLIDVASSAAFAPVPNFAAYAASKAFLLSFSEALRAELRDQPIDVLTLCPGATKSDFGARAGYRGGQMPFAAHPDRVVDAALGALGRTPTLATGPEGVALNPAALGRAAFAGALGFVTSRMARRDG